MIIYNKIHLNYLNYSFIYSFIFNEIQMIEISSPYEIVNPIFETSTRSGDNKTRQEFHFLNLHKYNKILRMMRHLYCQSYGLVPKIIPKIKYLNINKFKLF